MASLSDIAGIQQSGVTVLSQLQETQAKLVPTNSSGNLSADTLVATGFVRVLGVSVVSGSGGLGTLNDVVALPDITLGNTIYSISSTPGYYPVNMVFHKGLAFKENTGSCVCAIFYSRI